MSEESVMDRSGSLLALRAIETLSFLLCLLKDLCPRGTLHQYVGRLHRFHADKREVIVYDYNDNGSPTLAAMFRRRLREYEAAGYSLVEEESSLC